MGSTRRRSPRTALGFLAERHLATLTTLRPDGSPHVVAVGFTWDADAGLARVITFAPSRKARNLAGLARRPGRRCARSTAAGGSPSRARPPSPTTRRAWPRACAATPSATASPGERADRVVIEITVDRVLGRA